MARNFVRLGRRSFGQNCLTLRNEGLSWTASKRWQTNNAHSVSSKTIIDFAKIKSGPSLEYFIANRSNVEQSSLTDSSSSTTLTSDNVPYLNENALSQFIQTSGVGKKVYFETYGCQMNVNDTGECVRDKFQGNTDSSQ